MANEDVNESDSRNIVLSEEALSRAANQEEIVRLGTENESLKQRVYILRALVNQLQEEKRLNEADFDKLLAEMPKDETETGVDNARS